MSGRRCWATAFTSSAVSGYGELSHFHLPLSQDTPMLTDNPKGKFKSSKALHLFLSASSQTRAMRSCTWPLHTLPLERGFTLIERHLQSLQRPSQALCGMELDFQTV